MLRILVASWVYFFKLGSDRKMKKSGVKLKLWAILFFALFLSACTSKNAFSQQEKKRLQDNKLYAQLLFSKQAPDCLTLPLNSSITTHSQLAALDSLFIQQAKTSDSGSEPVVLLQEISKDSSFHIVKIDRSSPLIGQGCLHAFLAYRLEQLSLSRLCFPTLIGIEIEKTTPSALFLLQHYELGIPYTQLFNEEDPLEFLGIALGEFHSLSSTPPKPLSDQWRNAIYSLSVNIVERYEEADEKLREASRVTARYLEHMLKSCDTNHLAFPRSYSIGTCDLDHFFLKDNSSILCTHTASMASSIEKDSPFTPCGLPGYDYSRLFHHITLLSSQLRGAQNTRQLQQAFERGYRKGRGCLPSTEEIRFFLLIDLFDNIIKNHHGVSLSLLEKELIAWSTIVKKCGI